jgi:iron complex outermembrane recepter protein
MSAVAATHPGEVDKPMNHSHTRASLLAGAALLSLTLPGVAFAQDAAEEAQPAADVQTESDDSAMGNEIIITATKREQTLQSTPVAVSVTTAETIERAQIRDITDLVSVVPSLRVSQSQSQFATTYSIRGFGTSGNNLGLEPSVAVFVDGVYRSRSIAQISDLPDIQRIEVLRGPQSTLFGKNASAGVISIISKKPSFDLGGSVEASYGNYNAIVGKAYITGPLSETIAASFSAGINKRDGYVTNAFNGDDLNNRNRWFTRGQLLFEPNDQLKIRLIADYDQLDEKCCAVFNFRRSAASGAVLAVGGQLNDPATPFADVVYSDVVPTSKVRNYGFSGQIDYEVGPLTLTSITAYRDTKLEADQDVDYSSARLATGSNIGQARLKTFTEEFRIATDLEGPLNLLVGAYYFKEKADSADQIVYGADFRNYANLLIGGSATNPPNDLAVVNLESILSSLSGQNYTNKFFIAGQGFFNKFKQDNQAYSLFGNVDFKVTDRLTLTLGANYTHDSKNVSSNSVSTDVFAGVDLTALGQTAIFQGALAQQIGNILALGRSATGAEIGAFATSSPTNNAIYNQVVAGTSAFAAANASNPLVNPLLGLRPFQFLKPILNIPNVVENGKTRDGDWSYVARLAYEVNDHLNVYASWATGFKASSWNLSRDSSPLASDLGAIQTAGIATPNLRAGTRFARPENSEVFELGIKGNWGIASANLTVFKQSIKDFQANTFVGTAFVFANAEKQSTFGVEFDGRVNPTRELSLMVAMTYLKPKYDVYTGSVFGDVSGETIGNITQLSATWGAQWDKELASGDHLILSGDFHYEAPVQVEPGLTNYIGINPDGSPNYAPARLAAAAFRREINDLNASITYAFDMGLEVSVWGRNLLDHRYVADIFDSVAQNQSVSGYTNQPRTYGVAARFKF